MSDCPCGSGRTESECCGRFLDAGQKPETAEELMRARYTAHTRVDLDYIAATHDPASREAHDGDVTRRWIARAEWLGLDIRRTEAGGPGDDSGVVEFIAHYRERGERRRHHEVAEFRRGEDGNWLFVDGEAPKPETVTQTAPKVGRNDPCPCGSGKKYKKCCLAA